ncbi:hypothetical protein C7999DRAFT_39371 [Corynascus novoguineensis]|uniref:Copper-fist domain-containing protein n=1 Tax=Corynascus novoguineensis TaxID=1126955 RepID=A0AAN7HS50_9PEZI|nr:hypothetical protein C7999DRAFT_39371 [Corynascus novoguineensis]
MPIINGQKMACAPCIRGHRSTKCNHFYDRVMIPVRKPGRPLSTCPCPPGRPCACGGVRVAIPKKQKCGCPTGAEEETEDHGKELPPAEPPMSPHRPSFRVGKPSSGKATSRKQSFDPASLERMDPGSINLIAAPSRNETTNGVPNGIATRSSPVLQGPGTSSTGVGQVMGVMATGPGSTYGSAQNHNFVSPMPYGISFPYPQPNQLQHGVKLEDGLYPNPNGSFVTAIPSPAFPNGNHTSPPLGSPAQPAMLTPKTNGVTRGASSCCSSKAQKSIPSANSGPMSQQGYGQPYIPQPQASSGSSCCASKTQGHVPATNTNPAPLPVYSQSYMPQFPYPTVFRYPGDYGSWQHPIDPAIWQQVASQTTLALTTPVPPTPNGATNETGNGDANAADDGTSHQCGCGEGCQCVGCLAHPFNAQMFQYVNNAYNGSNGSSPGDSVTGGQAQAVATNGQDSPAEVATPAVSEGSPPQEEQSLSTMDYFFVNLPISGLCGGHLDSCPCGDSCDCPGCLVHKISLN